MLELEVSMGGGSGCMFAWLARALLLLAWPELVQMGLGE